MNDVERAVDEAAITREFVLNHDRMLRELPVELRKIPLRRISVYGCSIRTLPDWLVEFPDLTTLDIGMTSFGRVPPVVFRLRGLRHLGLAGIPIRAVPEGMSGLARLHSLALSACGLISLPSWLGTLPDLRNLDLGSNDLAEIDPGSLPGSLKYLDLSGNALAAVPVALGRLPHLRVLLVKPDSGPDDWPTVPQRVWPEPTVLSVFRLGSGSARLTEIPDWLFERCPKLTWLDLRAQAVGEIPPNIVKLDQLRGIRLAGNRIETLPAGLFDLPQLELVDLQGNRLTTAPPLPVKPERLTYVNLADNPLPVPPEVLRQPENPQALWDYLTRTRADTRRLDEAKVLVVGEGAVGKTSLVRRLVGGAFDEDERKTDGIEVTRWSIPVDGTDIALNVWDFGGQEIMHATHQFFLTKRSVYILVLDARQGEEQNRIEYWLKLVHGFSGGSPVIVVGNKCEKLTFDIDQRGLRAKYPNIVAILETSCAEDKGIAALRKTLTGTIRDLPHVRDLLPRSFFDVKAYLERLDADYLPFTEYQRLCREHGVDTRNSQELLVGFLHDLGTVLCFRDDPRLRDTNILNPGWVTGGVYRLLNANRAAQLKGLLRWRDIDAILRSDDYPSDRRAFVVEMMKKFELCFESDGTFLVPDLLTKEEPDTGSWQGALRFTVAYDVLPSSVIGRLIVRMHQLINRRTVWRTGMVLKLDGNRALVKADREDGLLTVLVDGPPPGRRGLLTAVRAQLRAIEETIPGLSSEERVPVPGHDGIWVPYSHLLRLEEAGKATVVPQGLVDEFPVAELLDGIETRGDRVRSGRVVAAQPEPAATVGGTDARAWTPREVFLLGGFCLAAVAVLVGVYIGAQKLIGGVAAAAVAAALAAVVVIAFFMLRAAGRVSEQTLLDGVKHATSPAGGSEPAE